MKKETRTKPVAVLISDVHFNLNTVELATTALTQAITKANELDVPLVVAGDLHDTKANFRGECINALLKCFSLCSNAPYILIGNHCRLNEKAPEHGLNFLDSCAHIVSSSVYADELDSYLLPYYHDPEELKAYLKTIPKGSRLIMHQGVEDSHSGDYIQDKSALPKECFKDFRVISGHYHRRQDIKCGPPRKGAIGLFSYIGNPYTLGFGEANDPAKGFQVLYNDGTLDFVPTKLRRHIILDMSYHVDVWVITGKEAVEDIKSHDLVWVKVSGPQEVLALMSREKISRLLNLKNFKLTMHPNDVETIAPKAEASSQKALLDSLIDSTTNVSSEAKARIKDLWKGLV